MKKRVELPIVEPLYKTYNHQGNATAVLKENPSIENWYLNEIMNLSCNRKFLNGYTTPEITVVDTNWIKNPYLEKKWILYQFAKGYINPIIRELINNGYYVCFGGVDDYYVEGKSWYKELHRGHDGLICGYDQNDKTYCIYSYDSQWIQQKFWTSQKGFMKGCKVMLQKGKYVTFCGVKPTEDKVEISLDAIYKNLIVYLDSSLEKYPMNERDREAYGIIVHEYIRQYVKKLADGSIPYQRMDRRVFRLIWEHKKNMLKRIAAVENVAGWDNLLSKRYACVVEKANNTRTLYAAYSLKRRDSLLSVIDKNLLEIMKEEKEILATLVNRLEKELKK